MLVQYLPNNMRGVDGDWGTFCHDLITVHALSVWSHQIIVTVMIWWQFTLSCLKPPYHSSCHDLMTVHTLMSEATWSQTSASKTHNKAPRYSLQCMDAERYLLPDVGTLSLLAKRENWCALWVFLGILLCPAVHKTRRLPFLDTFLLRRAAQELQMSTAYFHDYSRWWQTELNSCTNVKKGTGGWEGGLWENEKRWGNWSTAWEKDRVGGHDMQWNVKPSSLRWPSPLLTPTCEILALK